MKDLIRRENELFEDEVRRIARLLWPEDQYSGAAKVDGRERDGIFVTEECIHLLEATTSRAKAKAEDDIKKLVSLAVKYQRNSTKAIRCWFVTKDEPTADQRKVTEKHKGLVNALSFAQFQSRLIDARGYLTARDACGFGSVRDPATGRGAPPVDYIELQLSDRRVGAIRSPRELRSDLLAGKRLVILGDYGAGKSMTMRFLYQELRAAYFNKKTPRFPIFLNLREHYGQTDPSEVLERHARTIGFHTPSHLVRAWRAGYVDLLIDGFDEITTVNIQGLWKRLRDNRYRAMEAVRRLLRDHPVGCGLALSGRAHFFDSDPERKRALGLDGTYSEYSLTEFNDEQIREYLKRSGFEGTVPSWLPSRPLLVAYLAARGLLVEVAESGDEKHGNLDPVQGWDFLLDRIAAREAEIEAGIDGNTVRKILERLATKARAFEGGLGPLTGEIVTAAFREVCGYAPEERGMILLQRLPGLGIDRADEETRSFVDEDFVDACRAGDILEFIVSPYSDESPVASGLECSVGPLAIGIVSRKCAERAFAAGKLNAAISRARSTGTGYLLSDIVRCSMEMNLPVTEKTFVKDILVSELDLPTGLADTANVEFQDCYFSRVGIDSDCAEDHLPKFRSCYIAILEGRLSVKDLPLGCFEDCSIEEFAEDATTTNAVLSLDLPIGVRVLLTMLKKLYEQRGSGRRENALFRGLDGRSRRLVPDVLRLLQKEKLVTSCRRGTDTIWLPERASRRRIGKIIASPTAAGDPLIAAAAILD